MQLEVAGADDRAAGGPRASNGVRIIDVLSDATGIASAVALLAMAAIICFEVFSRYVLNEPTYWGSDIATYVLVGMTFMGLAQAQKAGDHVQVELLLTSLDDDRRRRVEIFANWLGLTFVLFAAWQMAIFNRQEYVNDTRDWGLLSTPQWIPELPVTIGLVTFALAILADIARHSRPRRIAGIAGPLIAVALVAVLVWLGTRPMQVGGYRVDVGSTAIIAAVLAGVLLVNGIRMFAVVAASIAGLGLLYWAAKGAALPIVSLLMVLTLLGLLVAGVRVALTLGIVGLLGLMFLLPTPLLSVIAERSWNSVNTFTLTAVPMFVLMGALLIRSGVTRELFDSLTQWFGRTPGGVAHATIGASAVFAAVSGSSLATAATMGKVACPEMISRGYSRRLTYGSVAAGATLGILIPPSIAMIIYGTTVGVPVTQLFIAGIIPGILLSVAFMGGIAVWSMVRPSATPAGEQHSLGAKVRGTVSVLPFVVVIVVVLGSLYAGVATPTEAGAVGAAASFVICLLRGMLSPRALYDIAMESVRITSFLLLIVVGAAIMSWVFDYLRIPRTLVSEVEAADLAPWLVVLVMAGIYVVLGMFIESISMMLMTLPVTYPIVVALGLDPIWFGVALVIMIEIGLVTPPVGIVLFILRGVGEKIPLREIVYGVMPFIAILLAFQVLIYLVPDIVTWLPAQSK
ncbi:TRAP transporter large permease subunit [Microbaculum marinum]|uniref:TRAP transporter large permease subunit n=1 Tax=Microbaculum marinum TaxID=1764581 RepID=A0AAW9RED1_9HYPH